MVNEEGFILTAFSRSSSGHHQVADARLWMPSWSVFRTLFVKKLIV